MSPLQRIRVFSCGLSRIKRFNLFFLVVILRDESHWRINVLLHQIQRATGLITVETISRRRGALRTFLSILAFVCQRCSCGVFRQRRWHRVHTRTHHGPSRQSPSRRPGKSSVSVCRCLEYLFSLMSALTPRFLGH